jgi:hypothetical protein
MEMISGPDAYLHGSMIWPSASWKTKGTLIALVKQNVPSMALIWAKNQSWSH